MSLFVPGGGLATVTFTPVTPRYLLFTVDPSRRRGDLAGAQGPAEHLVPLPGHQVALLPPDSQTHRATLLRSGTPDWSGATVWARKRLSSSCYASSKRCSFAVVHDRVSGVEECPRAPGQHLTCCFWVRHPPSPQGLQVIDTFTDPSPPPPFSAINSVNELLSNSFILFIFQHRSQQLVVCGTFNRSAGSLQTPAVSQPTVRIQFTGSCTWIHSKPDSFFFFCISCLCIWRWLSIVFAWSFGSNLREFLLLEYASGLFTHHRYAGLWHLQSSCANRCPNVTRASACAKLVAVGRGLLWPLPRVRSSLPGAADRPRPVRHGAQSAEGAEDLRAETHARARWRVSRLPTPPRVSSTRCVKQAFDSPVSF